MRWVGAGLIGVACAFLQPEQPQSAIATVLLLFGLNMWHDGRRP